MTPRFHFSAWQRVAVIGFVAAALFTVWRSPGNLVWDDTPTICQNLYGMERSPFITFENPDFWFAIWREDFGTLSLDGYRPLNWALRRIGMASLPSIDSPMRFAYMAVNAVIVGLLAASYFCFARRFTRSDGAATFAVFLLLASTPMLTGLLVLFTGIQALVPLLMCAALGCYYQAIASRWRWAWLLVMVALLFLGTWYREFVGLTAIVILFLEWQRVRLKSSIAAIAVLLFLHAVFPTAILHALWFPDLPVRPVFQLGVLAEQTTVHVQPHLELGDKVAAAMRGLKWRIFFDLPSILPPTLLVIAVAAWIVSAVRFRRPVLPWRETVFLSFFFLVTFLPFLKVFKEQVHLAYCLVPACVMVAASIESLWRSLADWPHWRTATAALLAIPMVDHAANPIIIRNATAACYFGINHVAEVCRDQIPPGSIVISNAHHLVELKLRCQGTFAHYFTAITGGGGGRLILDAEALESLLGGAGEADVFCLDVRLPVEESQLGHDREHYIVRQRLVDSEKLGRIGHVSFTYPVIDPLRYLLPVENVAWPMSPDLEFDFYRGPALSGGPWRREVAVDYLLYKVTDRTVRRSYPQPTLLVDDYHGFNVVGCYGRVYAIPRPEGAFVLARVRDGSYSRTYEDATAREVLAQIDRDMHLAQTSEDRPR